MEYELIKQLIEQMNTRFNKIEESLQRLENGVSLTIEIVSNSLVDEGESVSGELKEKVEELRKRLEPENIEDNNLWNLVNELCEQDENMEEDDGYDAYSGYSNRFIELITKQRDTGLSKKENVELSEKCKKMIDKITWQLK